MRKIKFREFDKERHETDYQKGMSYGTREDGDDSILFRFDHIEDLDVINKDGTIDRVLMQFTGLTDINGKDIYEDDIVKEVCASINGVKSYRNKVVKWREFHAGFNIENIGLEVIGNIHENPELIPEEKSRMLIEGDSDE